MNPRVVAAAWTVFTALAAPALLWAADEPVSVPPPVSPTTQAPPAQAPPVPAVEPAPAPGAEPAQAAPEPQPADPPAAEPAPAKPERAATAKPKRKPVARAAASASVTITDFDFTPQSVTVNVGDTVTWTNEGPTVHTATGDGFDTGNLRQGESGSHTFTSAGTFSYICTPHPFMKGTVTVQAASAGEDTGTDTGTGTAGESADDGPSLPDTGGDTLAFALIGTGLLSLGFAVRRRAGSA